MTEQKELNNKETETQTQTFGQATEEYEPNRTGLISDLDFFTTDEPVVIRIGNKGKKDKDGTSTEFKYKALLRDEREYRIPWGVFEDVQNLQEQRLDKQQSPWKAFQVIKSGTGREHTKYQTIPHISGV